MIDQPLRQEFEQAANMQVDQDAQEIVKDGFFADLVQQAACSVRVAVRVRPLMGREVYEEAKICVESNTESNEITVGDQSSFGFDKTYGINSRQESVFLYCVKNLVLGCFAGFNATVLAYGQTGSGKTYTMGSGYLSGVAEENLGIIPRVIKQIFSEVNRRKSKADIAIKCAFLEIYNEEIIDLLDHDADKMKPIKKDITIREEKNGAISVYGVKEVLVKTEQEMAGWLDLGSSARSTASTLMNQQSSRSHGIFTITIEQSMLDEEQKSTDELIVAKFHFVDLAGSERAKKTGATGSTLKEGININKSLLALGNVISALTAEDNKAKHVPYRDSKLTRILQDSLGGNSRTVMIACCSPAESNFDETLNTLKYASRARNIKNKPVVNRDPASQQILELRQQVYELQKELLGSRKLLQHNNIQFESQIVLSEEAIANQSFVPVLGENSLMSSQLHQKISQKEKQICLLEFKLGQSEDQCQQLKAGQFETVRERDYYKLMAQQMDQRLKQLGIQFEMEEAAGVLEELQNKLQKSSQEIQEFQKQLRQLQNDNQKLLEQSVRDTQGLESRQAEIEKLQRQIQQSGMTPQKLRKGTVQIISQKSIEGNWLSSDLDHKIKHFDEIRQMFKQDLGNQMTTLVTKPQITAGDVEMQSMSSEDELSDDQIIDLDIDQQGEIEEEKLQQQQKIVTQLTDQVKDKEALLEKYKQSQKEIEESLLTAMKEQYQQRVVQLEEEIIRLEAEKKYACDRAQGANKTKLDDTYTKKIQEKNQQANFLRQKDKEAQNKQKLLEQQQQKMKQLESDIEKIRTQKVVVQKKLKDDQDKFKQYKQDRAKELMMLKANLSKKERENQVLRGNLKKKDLFAKRKQEENALLQQKQKLDLNKKLDAQMQRNNSKGIVDEGKIRDWIIQNTKSMLECREIIKLKTQKEQEFLEIEADIEDQQQLFAKQSIAVDRLEQQAYAKYLDDDDVLQDEQDKELQQLKSYKTVTKEQIESLEARITFIQDQILQYDQHLNVLKPGNFELKVQSDVVTLEGARVCIKNFFFILLDAHIEAAEIQNKLDVRAQEYEQLVQQYQEMCNKNESNQILFENSLSQLREVIESREKLWTQVVCEKVGVEGANQIDLKSLYQLCVDRNELQSPGFHNEGLRAGVNAKLNEREIKKENVNQIKGQLSKQVAELQQQLKQSEMSAQRLNNELMQSNRDKIKYKKMYEDLLAKTKKSLNIQNATPEPLLSTKNSDAQVKMTFLNLKDARNARKIQKQEQEICNVEEVAGEIAEMTLQNDSRKSPKKEVNNKRLNLAIQDSPKSETVFNRLNRSSIIKKVDDVQFTLVTTEEDQWRMSYDKQEAHKSQIYAMTSVDNLLYSSAAKSLKIWNIETMQYISDLPEKIGVVKCMQYWKERNLLLTASDDKNVTLWSVVDLTIAGTVKTNLKDEIKCMELVDDKLFIGTKGTQQQGGLLIYDLRKHLAVYEEKAKDQDVFSLKASQNHVFMGCRNHFIYPVDAKSLTIGDSLAPPHYGVVTSLAILGNNSLISGSKDKNLRSYRLDTFEHLNSQMNAHSDQITTLDSDMKQLFSGSKDGVVKVWRQSDGQDLVCKAKLEGNGTNSCVNALCKIDSRYGSAFACGSSDKSIRVWVQTKDTDSELQEKGEEYNELLNLSGSALRQLRMHKQKKQMQL